MKERCKMLQALAIISFVLLLVSLIVLKLVQHKLKQKIDSLAYSIEKLSNKF